ncbi:MAG: aromatic aminobenezylarsenical efflux permease ArsG family transporter [Pseudomonadota bacterium]
MITALVGAVTALWLGILTSISPCPLATNIAAISFIGSEVTSSKRIFVSGLIYTLGRAAAYVLLGAFLVAGLLQIPPVAWFLQRRMNQVLGPLLFVIGLIVLGWIRIPLPSWSLGERSFHRAKAWGLWGIGFLGFIFGLSFCPVSAGLYFGSLIPLAITNQSPVILPTLFGIGTALPVVMVATLLAFGANYVGRVLDILGRLERWGKQITGVTFLVVGAYLSWRQFFAPV